MLQKQKPVGNPSENKQAEFSNDDNLLNTADKGNAIAEKLQQALQKKKGHWEHSCCGRRWVED